jgi:hypothetical protein
MGQGVYCIGRTGVVDDIDNLTVEFPPLPFSFPPQFYKWTKAMATYSTEAAQGESGAGYDVQTVSTIQYGLSMWLVSPVRDRQLVVSCSYKAPYCVGGQPIAKTLSSSISETPFKPEDYPSDVVALLLKTKTYGKEWGEI